MACKMGRAWATTSSNSISSFAIRARGHCVLLHGLRELRLVLVHDGKLLLLRGAHLTNLLMLIHLLVVMWGEPVSLRGRHVLLA